MVSDAVENQALQKLGYVNYFIDWAVVGHIGRQVLIQARFLSNASHITCASLKRDA